MDGSQTTGTAAASVMLARAAFHGRSVEAEMRSRGGACGVLADRLAEGHALVEKGRAKAGWFSSRAMRQAETDFRARSGKTDAEAT